MIGRLLLGVIKGLLLGGGVLAALVYGLHVTALPLLLAYAAAVLTGALTGLIAGKPIWQKEAKIEAGLKALGGALLSAGVLWAVLRWVPLEGLNALAGKVSLPGIEAGSNVLALPLVAVVLAVLFELDNTPSSAAPADKQRVAELSPPRARVDAGDGASEAGEEVAPRSRAKR